jgi:hypothetical protein
MAGNIFQKALLVSQGIKNLHDNARPHFVNHTGVLLQHFGWKVMGQPLSNPKVMPVDFCIFWPLRSTWLASVLQQILM